LTKSAKQVGSLEEIEPVHVDELDDFTDADGACKIIGGQDTPVSHATLYRGVKAGIYHAPLKPSPGISRWFKAKLRAEARAARGS
jgi:hypothetical protein